MLTYSAHEKSGATKTQIFDYLTIKGIVRLVWSILGLFQVPGSKLFETV